MKLKAPHICICIHLFALWLLTCDVFTMKVYASWRSVGKIWPNIGQLLAHSATERWSSTSLSIWKKVYIRKQM